MRDISSCSKPRKVSTFRILRAYLVVLRVDRFMACPYWCSLANCLRKRWVYRKRHLSSLPALRANDDVGNVRLERTIRLIYSKLKARSKLRTRTRSDSASHLSTGSDPRVRSNPLPPTTIGEMVLGHRATLATTTTSLQDFIHMGIRVPLLIEKRRWWSGNQRRSMRRCF